MCVVNWADVTRSFNSGTLEAEASRSWCLRPAWSVENVSGQSGLQRKILSQKSYKREESWMQSTEIPPQLSIARFFFLPFRYLFLKLKNLIFLE